MKYIIVNSVKDGNRYLRKENKKKSNTTFNVACVHLFDFAKEIVTKAMAKKGSLKALDILDSTSGAVLLLEMLEERTSEYYFVAKESLSQETAQEIWGIMQQVRMGATTQAYEANKIPRVVQIMHLIEDYEKLLEQKEQYDTPSLYKKAIQMLQSEAVPGKKDNDTIVISDVCKNRLTAIEQEFLDMYTQKDYSVFTLPKATDECLKGAEFFKAYGMVNEVNYVVSQILEKKQMLGDVEIFYTAADYEPYLEAVFHSRKIPYAITKRQLPGDNDYIHLMKYILEWAENNYAYESLKAVMMMSHLYRSTYFSEIRAGIGWGAERYHTYIENLRAEYQNADEEQRLYWARKRDYAQCIELLLSVFEWKEETKISCSTVFWRLVEAARSILGNRESYKMIANGLKDFAIQLDHVRTTNNMEEVIDLLSAEMKKVVYSDMETTSSVSIRKLDAEVHILERKHIYILGMSNAHFSGAVVDSPVLSDAELEMFLDVEKGYVNLKKNQEEKKKQALMQTLVSRDEEGSLTIGYCCYDTINLRSMSPAIPYIRMMQSANVTESQIAYAGYENIIQQNISFAEKDVWQDITAVTDEPKDETEIVSPIECWSTTSLQQLLSCPLQFYYQRVLRLPDESYKTPKPDTWLQANEKGTLAHGIMEDYCNEVFLGKEPAEIPAMIQEAFFEEILDKRIKEMLVVCPYTSKAAYEIECDTIRQNCKNYLKKMHREFSDPNNKWVVISCEEDFKDIDLKFGTDEESILLKFRGQIDRLDSYVDEDGVRHYRIMDYKSGRYAKHQTDINAHRSIQHVVYKLAVEAMKKDLAPLVVDQVSFLHFFEEDENNQEITLKEADIADFPTDVHAFVLQVLKERKYEKCSVSDAKDFCKYCTYRNMCMEHIGEKL